MQLVRIADITPSTYNPREADPERLRLIELSLTKLGFLLPIYVCRGTGEILSGHQRHYVAQKIGLEYVPVEYVKPLDLAQRKAYNIAFNRGTNDLQRYETSQTVKAKIKDYDIESLIKNTPDVTDFYPCFNVVKVNGKELAKRNIKNRNKYSSNLARTLSRVAGYMPVVITDDLKVINGIGRLFNQLEKGIDTIDCVVIPKERAKLAYVMLNLVSMDFNIHRKYNDDLRFNSFRRNVANRGGGLGRGFMAGCLGNKKSKDVKELKGDNLTRFVAKYGMHVVDFGAGRFTDTNILRKAGLNVYPFEPYICNASSDKINIRASIENTKRFLEAVASKQEFSSIFVSSVLNSVPFVEDRLHIINICAALSDDNTLLTIWAMNTKVASINNINSNFINERQSNCNQFKLDYEENILLGDIGKSPKVQKYHTKKELIDLVKNNFSEVKITLHADNYLVECRKPKIHIDRLTKALEFEFNLPYPDGSRMGLAEEAKQAFSKRLGVRL